MARVKNEIGRDTDLYLVFLVIVVAVGVGVCPGRVEGLSCYDCTTATSSTCTDIIKENSASANKTEVATCGGSDATCYIKTHVFDTGSSATYRGCGDGATRAEAFNDSAGPSSCAYTTVSCDAIDYHTERDQVRSGKLQMPCQVCTCPADNCNQHNILIFVPPPVTHPPATEDQGTSLKFQLSISLIIPTAIFTLSPFPPFNASPV